MFFIGMVHVLMHYGVMPQQVAEKSREAAMRATVFASQVARRTIVSIENVRNSVMEASEKEREASASSSRPGEVELGPPTFANKAQTGRDL